MMDLDKLSPAALSAVMRGGTADWGQYGSVSEHVLYIEPVHPSARRRMCHCGCRKRVTYSAYANGVCMASGCEMQVRRFVKKYGGRG